MPRTVCGSLRVNPPFDPSRVSAVCSLNTTNVDPGEYVAISTLIRNDNYFPALVGYEITVGERVIDSEQVRVGSNTTVTETVRHQFGFVGSYNVDVSITAQEAARR